MFTQIVNLIIDIKPDNVFINYHPNNPEEDRFQDIKLGDFGDTYPIDAYGPSSGAFVGIPEWASPEMMFELPWTTATDIWSFGALLISLIYGGNFNLFAPQGPVADLPEEQLAVLVQHYQWFGPFPKKFREIAREDAMMVVERLEQEFTPEMTSLFRRISRKEVSIGDRDFLLRIMKLD
ncbi:SPS1 Serine threonine protein kinase [Pyrenophora tritici-repentis]|nr:SPS1 Serine threonine protein kinase [Pyrenophora tritici-repentis]